MHGERSLTGNNSARVLLVEDDENLRDLLSAELNEEGFTVEEAASAEEAMLLVEQGPPDLVVSDLRLPGADGMQLLFEVRKMENPPSVIIVTAFGTVSRAVEALKNGADDFLTKPLDLDHFRLSVSRVLEKRDLRKNLERYRELLENEDFCGMIGQSEVMQRLYEQIRCIAQADGPVLLTGESGVGKELVARAVHQEGPRKKCPFVAVNCAGMPADLLESEFFGHVKGSFTGASGARKGLFAEADDGILFLDEISEMPLELQAKLLRVLEDGKVRPVGGTDHRKVDVRILAASNRDIEKALQEDRIRKDLYYRLETFTLHVPGLRERGDDLDLLAAYFLNHYSLKMRKNITGFSTEAMSRLSCYSFPGNVRELKNIIEWSVAFCDGTQIQLSHLPERIRECRLPDSPEGREIFPFAYGVIKPDNPLPLKELTRRYVRFVLRQVGGNKKHAASLLKIGRRTLYRYLEEET